MSRNGKRRARRPVTIDGMGEVVQDSPPQKLKSGAVNQGYVLDPFTGMPIADPSGALQDAGYERAPADTAVAIGDAATAAVKKGFELFTLGGKVLFFGAAIVLVIVAMAETRKALGQ